MKDAEIAELYSRDYLLANEKIVEKYSNYVYYTLHKYYPTYKEYYEDMYQEGISGILKALKTYDASRGAFTTYCTPFIRSECSAFIRYRQGEPSEHYAKLNRVVRSAEAELEQHGEEPSAKNIAEKTGISESAAERELKIFYDTEPISDEHENGEDAYAHLVDRITCENLLMTLPEEQRKIVFLRTVENMSFRKIAVALNKKEHVVRKKYYSGIEKLEASC